MVCGLLNVCYYCTWLYAIVVNLLMVSNKPSLDWLLCTWYVSWHFKSHGALYLMAFHASWYSTSCANPCLLKMKVSTGNFLNFIYEYLHVTTRGPQCVGEVTVELYHSYSWLLHKCWPQLYIASFSCWGFNCLSTCIVTVCLAHFHMIVNGCIRKIIKSQKVLASTWYHTF